jgi:serine/threonine protein phosphatase PrpC
MATDGLEKISPDQIRTVLARTDLTTAQKRDELIQLVKTTTAADDNITVALIQK